MKNLLILNGSPRRDGYTAELISAFSDDKKDKLNIEIINCNEIDVNYCTDCRACKSNYKCSINDDMQLIYKKIEIADIIVFATPVYFYSVSAQLKTVIDRLQVYFFRHIDGKNLDIKKKEGILISVGGAREYKDQFLSVETITRGAMKNINCELQQSFFISGSDNINRGEIERLKICINKYISTNN